MTVKASCIVCHEREAVLPDRNNPGRPVKRICRQCHADRLIGDLKAILVEEERRKAERARLSR